MPWSPAAPTFRSSMSASNLESGLGPAPEGDGRAFKVPVGLASDGRLVRAQKAKDGINYLCPGCRGPLLLRRGLVRSTHFAHKSSSFCSAETALHRGVKIWISLVLQKRLAHRRAIEPYLLVPCAGSRWLRARGFHGQCRGKAWLRVLDLAFDEVAAERNTPDGLRPDLLLLLQGKPVLGIEVRVTHAVDEAKAARTTYPWVELDALQVINSPRAWRPRGKNHPWTSLCRACQWADRVGQFDFSEHTDPGDLVAELAAALFQAEFRRWLQSESRRIRPGIAWRCPWCRKNNFRPLKRKASLGATRSSSLGPPILPEVVLELVEGPDVSITFGAPRHAGRAGAILPMKRGPLPALRAAPDFKRPLRLALNGTNRPLAFLCRQCGRDCLGNLPMPGEPLLGWESLALNP